MIKFLDLHKVNKRFEPRFQKAFDMFLGSGQYILGEQVLKFEKTFANYCGTTYCVGVSNGLDALTLIFKAYLELGLLKKNDEVIVPANTFVASILAIIETGLIPVLVEPDKHTYNISVEAIKSKISPKTKAIMAVHLYGQLADMDAVNTIAAQNDLLVIEDAAQAHGATNDRGQKAGGLGHAAAFSFYPSKNLGALGDAGAITTNDADLNIALRQLRNYGASSKYVYDLVGNNNRLDEIQAIILNIKLEELETDNKRRREIAQYYLSEIKNTKLQLPYYDQSKSHVFYAFVVLTANRTEFMDYLKDNQIEAMIHYPVPPHKQKALSYLKNAPLKITEKIHDSIVSLPISPVMTDRDVEKVVGIINKY
ncbi:DegT/DnrJ/EryC1/StrS family aminotransferase [Seonamhaeicola maritimus]|uniref:DegT/DnrJ/EryC1/StrS family aminotransferase n=1 Tax=Seonamhaeicola maritimus TaxID=2591822 RepID=UPI002494BD1C|nr:DegT/DnrJ/EryC1/StrS family aminotransferase [Seonamhaeicola maritimus]